MTLPKRPLGTSGLAITAVGLGAWAIGGEWAFGWGPQDDADSIATIRRATELGINWVDTAAIYGLGHSEEVLGRALAALPAAQRPMVFTKCGVVADPDKPHRPPRTDLRPETIRRECERSLQRLGVERIDLYQFHTPDASGTAIEDSWAEMSRLIAEGKVRAGGVSNFGVDLLERCEQLRHVDSLQPPFSMIRREAATDVVPWCAAHGTGVIVYGPMQAGILTDRASAERIGALAPTDWRRQPGPLTAEFRSPRLERNLALRDALRPIAVRHGVPVAAVAIAWTLAWPGVSGAIVGARSPDQIAGWIEGAAVTLLPEDLQEIAVAFERTGAGRGPLRPPSVATG